MYVHLRGMMGGCTYTYHYKAKAYELSFMPGSSISSSMAHVRARRGAPSWWSGGDPCRGPVLTTQQCKKAKTSERARSALKTA